MGVAIGQVVALYQTSILRRLPYPPMGPLDFNKVNASDYAYKRLQMPDAFLMAGIYAAMAALATAGDEDRARDMPWLPVAMEAKIAYDVAMKLKLAREEWQAYQALCSYCQTATMVSIAAAVLAIPEAMSGARWRLRG